MVLISLLSLFNTFRPSVSSFPVELSCQILLSLLSTSVLHSRRHMSFAGGSHQCFIQSPRLETSSPVLDFRFDFLYFFLSLNQGLSILYFLFSVCHPKISFLSFNKNLSHLPFLSSLFCFPAPPSLSLWLPSPHSPARLNDPWGYIYHTTKIRQRDKGATLFTCELRPSDNLQSFPHERNKIYFQTLYCGSI